MNQLKIMNLAAKFYEGNGMKALPEWDALYLHLIGNGFLSEDICKTRLVIMPTTTSPIIHYDRLRDCPVAITRDDNGNVTSIVRGVAR